jgi:MFS family permease
MSLLIGRIRFMRALRHRQFALLWFGQTISALGDGAYYTALAWLILLLTGSATAMGVVVIANSIPRLAFLLIGGVAADRLSRRMVMLWSDSGRAVSVLLITMLAWTHLLQLWHLVVLGLFFGLVDGFFIPAYQSIPPQLVPGEDLASANALNGLSQNVTQLIGPVLGATLVALVGPASAFGFDGLTFVISALCLFLLRLPISLAPVAPADTAVSDMAETGTEVASEPAKAGGIVQRGVRSVLADMREGLRYTMSSTWIWVTIVIASAGNIFISAPLVVALPKLVHDAYGSGVWLLGTLEAAGGAGSIAGILIVGQMKKMRQRGIKAYTALIGTGVALVMMGIPLPLAGEPFVASAANALLGFGIGFFNVIWYTVLQELIPGDKLGRVSSIDMLGSLCLTPIGYALGGVVTDRIGPRLVFIGCGIISALMPVAGLSVRGIRALD